MTGSRDRVLSGMRPTGQLHLGNFLGALENWVKLQDQYECFYFVANWHVLTTNPGGTREIPGDTIEMGADWLGAGLDPERSVLFIQSLVPEHAELHLLFSMATPVGWLERVPTYKEMVEQKSRLETLGSNPEEQRRLETMIVAVEKLLPYGELVARITGAALIGRQEVWRAWPLYRCRWRPSGWLFSRSPSPAACGACDRSWQNHFGCTELPPE